MSHERPGLLCLLLLLLSAALTWEGKAQYATWGKFLNHSYFVSFSPVPLLSLCPTAAVHDSSQLSVCVSWFRNREESPEAADDRCYTANMREVIMYKTLRGTSERTDD